MENKKGSLLKKTARWNLVLRDGLESRCKRDIG
jgi:hypothetical protein